MKSFPPKVDLIEKELNDLSAMQEVLTGLVRRGDADEPQQGWPIIHALSQDDVE